jgi:hypothetical protein
MVTRTMRHWPFDATCLRRSLVAGQRLRKLHPELNIGVALSAGDVIAHAWLTIGATSLDPKISPGYSVLRPVTG